MAERQADAPAVEAFQNLRLELANISQVIAANGISQSISKFDGNPKQFREWVKSIEKYATLAGVPDGRIKLLAYQTSGGAVSGFINRYITANPTNTWEQMKEQLSVRFSDVADAQMALSLLRRVKQKHGENIHAYAEKILALAEQAYNNQGGEAVERQLIDIFADGLVNDQLKIKIFREQPNTLQGAVGIATNEQNLRCRVQMSNQSHASSSSTDHTPMEIDHTRSQSFRTGSKFNRVNSAVNPPRSFSVKCWNCGKLGHILRDCRAKIAPKGHGQRIGQTRKTMGN